MNITKSNKIFIFNGTFDECMTYARPCRFRWNPHHKHWWTNSKTKADKLRGMIHHTTLQQQAREGFVPDSIPCPDGLAYMPFQIEAIKYSITHPNALLALEMGLGKTVVSIGLMNALPDEIKRVLIVCPASLKINWTREIMKWSCRSVCPAVCNGKYVPGSIVIINYDVLHKHHKIICQKEWDLVVGDEIHYCFPAGTMVATQDGDVDIAEIVNERRSVFVKSCDISNNVIEYKRAKDWIKLSIYTNIVEITHEYGKLRCTADHPIWTDEGYVEAALLKSGARLRILRQGVSDHTQRKNNGQILQSKLRCAPQQQLAGSEGGNIKGVKETRHRKDVRMVRCNIPVPFKRKKKQRAASLLRPPLRCFVENGSTRKKRNIQKSNVGKDSLLDRKEKTGHIRKDESKQSHEQPKDRRKDKKETKSKTFSYKERWQRTNYRTSTHSRRFNRPTYRISHLNCACEGSLSFNLQLLCSGSGRSFQKISNRSRRTFAQNENKKATRPAKDRDFICSRVVSVKVLEPRSAGQSRESSREDQFVYCLGVDGNENFFADGVLVSNCKSPTALRSKAFYSIPSKRKLYLTGTPILNRPIELQALLKGLGVPWAFNRHQFGIRYCDAKQGRYGWDYRGFSRLTELNQKLSESIMVRYRKKDVLKDLPDKRRELIVLSNKGNDTVGKEKSIVDALTAQESRLLSYLATAKGDDYHDAVNKLRDHRLFMFSEMSRIRHETARSKLPQTISCIKDMLEDTDKLVVFAHHHDIIDAIYKEFRDIAVTLTGKDSMNSRQESVDRFQTDSNCRLFIGNIKAAGVGLTLTAGSTVMFVELDWTPANMDQAESRLHRIGQKNSVNVYYLVIDDSLDCFMAKKLVNKEAIITEAIDNVSHTTCSNSFAQLNR